MDCDVYAAWSNRNTAKRNIKDSLHYSQVKSEREPNMSYEVDFTATVDGREMMERVQARLPVEYLRDFQCLTANISIPKQRRLRLMAKIKEILGVE